MMTFSSLSVDMKAAVALTIGFLIFWVVDTVGYLWTAPTDVGALLSLLVLTPVYVVLLIFAWKKKPWAYLGDTILSTFMLAVTVAGASFGAGPLKWDVVVAVMFLTVIFALMSIEGFKAYFEAKEP